MLYAAAKASPVFQGKVKKHDPDTVKNRPGVHSIIEFGGEEIESGIAVIADSYWHAKTALDLLGIDWDEGSHGNDTSEEYFKASRAALDEPAAKIVNKKGDTESVLKNASHVVEAVYEVPYLDHTVMEPFNCTAQVAPDRVDIWAGSQIPEDATLGAAKITGVPVENIYFHNCFIGGGFGRRGNQGDVRQGVAIAKQLGRRPVKVIWSREETTQHGHYRPMRTSRFRAALGKDGMPLAWHSRVIGMDENFSLGDQRNPGDDEQLIRGLHKLPYFVPNQLFDYHLRKSHVPTGAWTSLGRPQNEFFLETFVDEPAHAAGKDPYRYRSELLAANREFPFAKGWITVLDGAVENSAWEESCRRGLEWESPWAIAPGSLARRSRFARSWPLSRSPKKGEVRVERFDVTFDTGPFLVNPLAAERQAEMQVAMGVAATLFQEITIEKGRVTQANFDTLPLLQARGMPEIKVHFVRATDDPIAGIGEEVVGWVAPAICNAVFVITGERIRSLLLQKHDLSWT